MFPMPPRDRHAATCLCRCPRAAHGCRFGPRGAYHALRASLDSSNIRLPSSAHVTGERAKLARVLNVRHEVYQAQIHKRAMESAFPFRGRCKIGFAAIIKQARTGGKYRIKREACPLQSDRSKKSDIEVRPSSRARVRAIQSLYRIKCAKQTPPIFRARQVPIDPRS